MTMGPGSEKVKDPVCHMLVPPDQNALNYQGMDFAFCSQQCKDRFLADPHLYIGVPGEPAPKQEGQKVLKRRRLRLEIPLSDTDARQVTEQLLAMMGVYSVDIAADELAITYDLLQATAEQIEATLQQAGARLGAGRLAAPGRTGRRLRPHVASVAWDFRLQAVSIPVRTWHGLADHIVPAAMVRHLAWGVAAQRGLLAPGEGRLSPTVRRLDAVLEGRCREWSRRNTS